MAHGKFFTTPSRLVQSIKNKNYKVMYRDKKLPQHVSVLKRFDLLKEIKDILRKYEKRF